MNHEEVLLRLRHMALLADVSSRSLDILAAELNWIEIAEDEVVISHLARGASLFFVVSGACRVRRRAAAGRVLAIRQLNPGSHFGEIALLTDAPRTVDVVAAPASLLAECKRATFDRLMQSDPAFAKAVAASLAQTVVSLTERVFELAVLQVGARLHAELLRLAKRGELKGKSVLINDMPTRDAIAATIGAKRETISRELKELAAAGIVQVERRRLVIRDIDKLRALVRRRAGVTMTQIVDWLV